MAADRPAGADPAWPADAIEVGRIVDAWGLQGWIKVLPFADDPQALFSSRRWFVLPSDKAGPRPATPVASIPSLLKITQVKAHGEVVVALAQEVVDRDGAEALRGARVFVGRASFPTPDPDEFYWVDLIGLAVVNREGQSLGTVTGLLDTGPHSVLRVAPAEASGPVAADEGVAAERLIPFVAAYVDAVSLEQRLITVDWGLDF
ncbi:MAG: ribosome maturation factor RimM [Pseudomonadota bacterium]|nr:ribosome maturation factor RimM [Pseudomonadota bacterium]